MSVKKSVLEIYRDFCKTNYSRIHFECNVCNEPADYYSSILGVGVCKTHLQVKEKTRTCDEGSDCELYPQWYIYTHRGLDHDLCQQHYHEQDCPDGYEEISVDQCYHSITHREYYMNLPYKDVPLCLPVHISKKAAIKAIMWWKQIYGSSGVTSVFYWDGHGVYPNEVDSTIFGYGNAWIPFKFKMTKEEDKDIDPIYHIGIDWVYASHDPPHLFGNIRYSSGHMSMYYPFLRLSFIYPYNCKSWHVTRAGWDIQRFFWIHSSFLYRLPPEIKYHIWTYLIIHESKYNNVLTWSN